jgi:hypothetical protein
MPTYKFTLHSGHVITAEDTRDLEALSAELCSAGFLVIKRQAIGYSTQAKSISVLERAIASIEPSD